MKTEAVVQTSVVKKLEAYRKPYKKQTKGTDKDFDKLVKSYHDPNHALSYLRGYLTTQIKK